MLRSGTTERTEGRRGAVVAGIGVAAIGLALNPWTLARFFSPDGAFESRFILGSILILQAILVGAGLALVLLRPRIRASDVAATAVVWILLALGVEGLIRLAYGQDDLMYATSRRSEALGWETRPHFELTREMGHYGTVHFSTGSHGFRRYGSPETSRLRILVIGDSYTEAAQVSDGATYYDFIADSSGLDVEVFAYGTGAYGSLQEYMVLDRHIDEIRPDLILWQFCSNDLINNYRPLEARSLFENSWRRRPYLEDGSIRLRAPTMRRLPQVSRTAQFVASRRAIVQAARAKADSTAPQSIEAELSPDHPLVREAAFVTGEIMSMVRERAGGVPIVAFGVDRPEWLGRTYERIAAEAGIHFVGGVPESIEEQRARGVVIDGITNGHWNARGHGIVGRMLADSLVALELLPVARASEPFVAGRGEDIP